MQREELSRHERSVPHDADLDLDIDLAALAAVAAQLRDLSDAVAHMCRVSGPTAGDTDVDRASPRPAVDPETVRRLAADFGTDGALDVIRSFVAELPNRIAAIRQHLRTGDEQLIGRSTTTLRSGCSLVGAVALEEWCASPTGTPPLPETEDALRRLASRLAGHRSDDTGGA